MKISVSKIREIIKETLNEVFDENFLFAVDVHGRTYNLGQTRLVNAGTLASSHAQKDPSFVEFYLVPRSVLDMLGSSVRSDDLEQMHYETGEVIKL